MTVESKQHVLIAGGSVAVTLLTPDRYLAPYLAALEEAPSADPDRPEGQLVEFTPEGHGL